MSKPPSSPDDSAQSDESPIPEQIPERVGQAARQILDPLAQLFIAHGVEFAEAECLLKEAFFHAGRRELERADIPPNISRISMSTGLHRKDVKRLSTEEIDAANGLTRKPASARTRSSRSIASEIYTRWTSDVQWSQAKIGDELPLRAAIDKPSFEMLARQVSSDAHPRSMLEELKRLGLAELSDDGKSVRIRPGGFVPMLERTELLALLGDNLSDHLSTAVNNVLQEKNKHLEQAVFINELSVESIEMIQSRARQLWQDVMHDLVPRLAELEKQSKASDPDAASHRVRVGMYCYSDTPRDSADPQEDN